MSENELISISGMCLISIGVFVQFGVGWALILLGVFLIIFTLIRLAFKY